MAGNDSDNNLHAYIAFEFITLRRGEGLPPRYAMPGCRMSLAPRCAESADAAP